MKQPEPLAEQINRVAPKLPDNSSPLFISMKDRIKELEKQNTDLKMIIEKLNEKIDLHKSGGGF